MQTQKMTRTMNEVSADIKKAGENKPPETPPAQKEEPVDNPGGIIKDRDAPGVAEVIPAEQINQPGPKTPEEMIQDPKLFIENNVVNSEVLQKMGAQEKPLMEDEEKDEPKA